MNKPPAIRIFMKKILILGAGPFQLPAIQKAVASGLYVITLDYLPDNVGHRYSHQFVNCSTADMQGVAAAARELGVDGVCTFSSDVAVPSVAYTCQQLGLPGLGLEAAERMAVKHQFRQFQRERGFPHPAFVSGGDYAGVAPRLASLRYPLIFKPVDTSGSRGVRKIEQPDPALEADAFAYALSFSRAGTVCVEEFIDGVEVGGDGILLGGRFALLAVTHKHLAGFVVAGHSLPPAVSPADQARVRAVLEDVCAALGYSDGPLNFDVMVTPEQIVILEMSPRNGGNGIPAVIARATGVDVELATLQIALGETPRVEPYPTMQNAGSAIIGSPSDGVLRHMNDLEALRCAVPEVFDFYAAAQPGERVETFDHNGRLLGYALFTWQPPDDYFAVAARVRQALDVQVDPLEIHVHDSHP